MVTRLRQIYQIKVQLKGIRPPIWRRLLVADVAPLDELHHTLQIAMGWTNAHLHQFVSGRLRYGMVDPEFEMDWDRHLLDESDFKVKDVLKSEGDSIDYEYDFGDGWFHQIILEKVLPFSPAQPVPFCLKGKRACPPEDVGGVYGYRDFLDKWQDEKHPEYDEVREWAGDCFRINGRINGVRVIDPVNISDVEPSKPKLPTP